MIIDEQLLVFLIYAFLLIGTFIWAIKKRSNYLAAPKLVQSTYGFTQQLRI
jgi:hypothetical protein